MKMILSYLWRPLVLVLTLGSIIVMVILTSKGFMPVWVAVSGSIIVFLFLQVLIGMDIDGRFGK